MARIIRLKLPPFDALAAIRQGIEYGRRSRLASVPPPPSFPVDCTASLSGSEVVWRNADGVEVARRMVESGHGGRERHAST